jgi:glycosyltransferase involved in cell wall biosynthesis
MKPGHSGDLALLRETLRGSNVILLDELMSPAQAYGLIAMSDCFVSLHRSEGFGLGMAEAMLMGKPVIATGYSGNLDLMNRDNSLLVDYENGGDKGRSSDLYARELLGRAFD